ncbi:MAG: hypothetical protein RR555_02245 [Bacteroidales bacterium]
MTFKSFIDSPCGIRYMYDTLKLQSPCGRKMLLESRMMRSIKEVEKSYSELREMYDLTGCKQAVNSLLEKLHCLRDISGTIARVKMGAVLDDIELFEVKYLAILAEDMREAVAKMGIKSMKLPDLRQVVNILDPNGLKICSFYVYDAYSAELREVRSTIKGIQSRLEAGEKEAQKTVYSVLEREVRLQRQDHELQNPNHAEESGLRSRLQDLTGRMLELEGEIRRELSGSLKKFADDLDSALRELAKLDVLLAKSLQIREMDLCFPEISMDCKTFYKGMFHPQIKEVLQNKGKEFISIDIEFALEPVTIIGANMGGKTVVLKMTALCQLLFQFGFGIPAQEAYVDIKNNMLLCIGDEQNDLSGLSSFAAEIKAIDHVLCRVKRGERILALIDEPARTTNPVEGTALVSGLLRVLHKKEVSVLLTTHYNIEENFYKRLRVRGLNNGVMDYRLQEVFSGEIPHEAVEIAKSLEIDKEWIGETIKVLKETHI